MADTVTTTISSELNTTTAIPGLAAVPECQLLGGTFAYVLQGLLFTFVVIGLIIKKLRDKSARTWSEFILDSSKQMIGASWLHVLNIAFSLVLNELGGDQCTWYWLNITMDTTLGVFVNYQLHKLIYKVLIPKLCSPELGAKFKSGDYGTAGHIQWGKYFTQLSVWIVIVSIMKCVMVVIMSIANVPLVIFASFVLSPFSTSPDLKLIVVMVFTPLVMNTVQFWITDSFTRKKPAVVSDKKPRHPDAATEGLEMEELPLTHTLEEPEEELSDFPSSPFALLFRDAPPVELVNRSSAGAVIGDPRADTL